MITRLIAALSLVTLISCSSVKHESDTYANDRAQILNLMARYSHALDFRDPETFASTFAPNGVFHWARGEIKGRKAIRDWLASDTYDLARSAEEGAWPAAVRHFITNQAVEVNGEEARALSYWFQFTNPTAGRDETKVLLFGHYEDKLVKIEGEWYFAYRNIFNEGLKGRAKAGKPNPGW